MTLEHEEEDWNYFWTWQDFTYYCFYCNNKVSIFFIFFSFFFSTDFHLPIWLWVFIVQIRIRFFAGKELTWFPFEVPFILRLPLVRVLSEVDQMKNNDCVTLKIFLKILNSFENARFNRYCTQKWFEKKRLRVVV